MVLGGESTATTIDDAAMAGPVKPNNVTITVTANNERKSVFMIFPPLLNKLFPCSHSMDVIMKKIA
jgi:hypothetical protein